EPVDQKFVDEISLRAGGLPLVLEVRSRHFTYHERKQWPRILETLKQIPHEDIQKKFQMSFDSLTKRAKKLFLDIACFFVGMDKNLVVKVLQDEYPGFFPDIEIKYLVDKEVVRQENEEEPGQRTRLMVRNDVVGVLRGCLGIDSVRTIKCISNFEERMKLVRGEVKERVTVQLEAFRKMGNLRFIKLCDPYSLKWSCSSNDDMSCFAFKHLKYLEWEGFPCKSLDNFDMGNVVVIICYVTEPM
ncbi:TMV resistance protein N, partial [Tanacetum coccineum]